MRNGKDWEDLKRELEEARRNPEFKEELERFISITSGRVWTKRKKKSK